ncbi:protein AMN1 isoform X1 [Biomphalaria glabrata]|nr:protein AMN1 isoform X1 [Biomphalaria glabrata]
MAATGSCVFSIPSLFQTSTSVVIRHLGNYEDSLWETPANIKQAVLRLMSKRGLITDDNIDKVLYSRLMSLDLSISQVSDACLFKLSNMKQLYKIDLNSFKEANETITSTGIMRLSESCPNLQIVYLRRNIKLTDEAIVALSKNCPRLRELNVGGCMLLTDVSLRALGEYSHHLKSLNITSTQVTDSGVYCLCQGLCAQVLTEIDISGCRSLTDDTVELLIMMCPMIRILLFARCPNITEKSRVALEEKLEMLEGGKMKQISWTIY